jgi:mRNA-decapping enzyme subunit 2
MAMAGGGGLNRSSSRGQLPPQELLDDLCRCVALTLSPISASSSHPNLSKLISESNLVASRFVLNVPKEDLESFERILFLLEQAHWFYEDNSVEHNPSLKSLSFKDFTSLSKISLQEP